MDIDINNRLSNDDLVKSKISLPWREGRKGKGGVTFGNTATRHPHPNHPSSRGRGFWTFGEGISNKNHLFLFILLALLTFFQIFPPQVLAGARERNGEITKGKAVSVADCRALTVLEDGAYWPALREAIDKAQKEITLSFFTFKTKGKRGSYPDLILASLAEAAKRGIKVVVLLERGRVPDEQLNRDNLDTARRLQKKGVDVYLDDPDRTTHTKMVVVDKEYTFIGSHNLTQSALKYNHEISVLIKSPQAAAEALSYINSIITTEGEPLNDKD